ncbi:MAG TPA: PIG-L deacetylase family protein [Acidimicrobiales bacterium]|nr:PIG-L deacetylase family protein [Acidimicrobiales bacterium]
MPTELLEEVPERALAIFAHPDDSDVAAGGTLARWAGAGCEVHVVICALGDKGSSRFDEDVAGLVERRAHELKAAQEILGVRSVHQLNYGDGELENDLSLRRDLVGIIRSIRPPVLVCPDPTAVFFGEHYFNHHDHRSVGFAALDAAAPAARSPLYFPDAGDPTTVDVAYMSGSLAPNISVDITATIEAKTEAILCHQSQLGETSEWFRLVVRERAEQAGRHAGVQFAEAFRRIGLTN